MEFFTTIYFPSHWLLSHTTITKTVDKGERGMNPVEMTLINPRKEYLPSWRIKPATSCSQVLYAIDLATGTCPIATGFLLLTADCFEDSNARKQPKTLEE